MVRVLIQFRKYVGSLIRFSCVHFIYVILILECVHYLNRLIIYIFVLGFSYV